MLRHCVNVLRRVGVLRRGGRLSLALNSGMELSTFLFDLDGTIIDSIELILRSYRHTMELHRCNETIPPDEIWIPGLGTPLWAQFGQITEDKEEIERMVQTYRTYNLTHQDALVRPYEGVVDEIRRMKDAGKHLGVVTSKLHDGAMRGLRISGLDEAFDIVIGCDDVTNAKPHPEPVLKALAERGSRPPRCSGARSTAPISRICGPITGWRNPKTCASFTSHEP